MPCMTADAVRENIRVILDGPGCLGGYRAVWHTLCIQGIQVPRTVVQTMLKELDPEGSRQRRAHRLKRREYHNSGPNFAWHADGYVQRYCRIRIKLNVIQGNSKHFIS